MAAMSEKYRLYHLHLFIVLMMEEINELIRYGIAPLGFGYVRPLKMELQEKIRPLLEKISDFVREATTNMIEKTATPAGDEVEAEDWIRVMLEELKTRVSPVGDDYGNEMKKISSLLLEISAILDGNIR
jgi:hypothetical protein